MRLTDICKIKVDWMERYGNDPQIMFILKRGCKIAPCESFRYRSIGDDFYAEHDGEVRFYAHSKTDHNGFGWARYALRMVDGFDPAAAGWQDCDCYETDWGNGSTRHADCHYDAASNTVHLVGPWSSNSMRVKEIFGAECVSTSTLEGDSRWSIQSPAWYHRMRRQGRIADGTAYATHHTLDFVREAIDAIAPHLELFEGDYGWTVKRRGMPPKNERRVTLPPVHPLMSAEQMGCLR